MALIAGVVLDGPQVQHCAGEWPVLPVENAGVVLRLQILLRHFHQDFGLVSELIFHGFISLPAFACQMVFMLSGDSPMSARRIAPAAGLSPAAADAVGLAGVWEVRKSLAACGRCCAFNFAGQLLTCPVAIRSVFKVPPRLALCCAVRDVCIIALCCAAVKRFFQVWRIAQQSAGRFGCLAQQSAGPMM